MAIFNSYLSLPEGMFPGFGLLSKETAVVSLDPGPLGLEVDAPTGVVQQVRDPLGPTGVP